MKKIVIAIDSLKGCLTSPEANEAAAQAVRELFPACEVVTLPVADGGEGMQEVLITATGGKRIHIDVHNPLSEVIPTTYGLSGDGHTAFIEMASASGLPLVPVELRNPLHTTTYGTGEQIRDALRRGVRRFIIGLGGSATNDAGIGMLQALSFRFFNENGVELLHYLSGRDMKEVYRIERSTLPGLDEAEFVAACDVKNPFYGPEGAAHVFAPQKGANEKMVIELDAGLQQMADTFLRCFGIDVSLVPGAGAAGGMGGGLMALLNARLQPGIELLLTALRFDDVVKGADCIITGEGKADRQTLMGKVPQGILSRAVDIPTLLIAGRVDDADVLTAAGFRQAVSINPPGLSLAEAMKPETARHNIGETVKRLLAAYA